MNRRAFLKTAAVVTVGGAAGGFWSSFIEPRWLDTTYTQVPMVNLPLKFRGFRIALLTDIHLGPFVTRSWVENAVTLINSMKIDLVVLGGDFVIHSASYIEPCMRILAGLTPPSCAVLGNHDHWEDAELTETLLHDLVGSEVLRNRGTWITRGDASIRIWGVGDLWEDEQLLDGCRPDRYNGPVILITHNPDFAEEIPDGTADLVLAGHTHGGQVVLPIIGAPILPSYYGQKYRSGTVWNGKTMVYVSRGIGVGSPPVRLNCRPELAVLELCSANQAGG